MQPLTRLRKQLTIHREKFELAKVTLSGAESIMEAQRYFYHSFPRSVGNETTKIATGQEILRSLCVNGLLLVPEIVSWSDPTQQNLANRTHAAQRRASFTELAPSELAEHSSHFGDFALEFTHEALLRAGALPVMYVPDRLSGHAGADGMGASLLAHLAAATAVLKGAEEFLRLEPKKAVATITPKSASTPTKTLELTGREARAVQKYLAFIAESEAIPLGEVWRAMAVMSSIFYPTEHPRYTGRLGYYQQREWRIVSGLYINGTPTTLETTREQIEGLYRLNNGFFSGRLRFPDGKDYSRAEKSHFLKDVDGAPFFRMVRRVIVPKGAKEDARAILDHFGFSTAIDDTAC